jgi:hypothetical protein
MSFYNPIWLWSLTGLLVPVVIHLLSRKEGRTILVGSVRHLQESATAQFRSIHLNEIVLLLLRCFLIMLIVLLLAGGHLINNESEQKKWIVLEKGIEHSPYKKIIKQLELRGFEAHLLSPDFPLLADSSDIKPVSNYWAMAEALSEKGIDSVIVLSYNYLKNFKGERISHPNFQWLVQDPVNLELNSKATKISSDSVWLRKGFFTAEYTSYLTTKLGTKEIEDSDILPPDTIKITVVSEKAFEPDALIILAGLNAIQSITPCKLLITTSALDNFKQQKQDWVVWLSNAQIPLHEDRKYKVIGYNDCANGNLDLLVESNAAALSCELKDSDWVITDRLNEENVLVHHFTSSLAELLLSRNQQGITDKRTLSQAAMWSPTKTSAQRGTNKEVLDLDKLLAILIMVTLMTERWVAYKRNQ